MDSKIEHLSAEDVDRHISAMLNSEGWEIFSDWLEIRIGQGDQARRKCSPEELKFFQGQTDGYISALNAPAEWVRVAREKLEREEGHA